MNVFFLLLFLLVIHIHNGYSHASQKNSQFTTNYLLPTKILNPIESQTTYYDPTENKTIPLIRNYKSTSVAIATKTITPKTIISNYKHTSNRFHLGDKITRVAIATKTQTLKTFRYIPSLKKRSEEKEASNYEKTSGAMATKMLNTAVKTVRHSPTKRSVEKNPPKYNKTPAAVATETTETLALNTVKHNHSPSNRSTKKNALKHQKLTWFLKRSTKKTPPKYKKTPVAMRTETPTLKTVKHSLRKRSAEKKVSNHERLAWFLIAAAFNLALLAALLNCAHLSDCFGKIKNRNKLNNDENSRTDSYRINCFTENRSKLSDEDSRADSHKINCFGKSRSNEEDSRSDSYRINCFGKSHSNDEDSRADSYRIDVPNVLPNRHALERIGVGASTSDKHEDYAADYSPYIVSTHLNRAFEESPKTPRSQAESNGGKGRSYAKKENAGTKSDHGKFFENKKAFVESVSGRVDALARSEGRRSKEEVCSAREYGRSSSGNAQERMRDYQTTAGTSGGDAQRRKRSLGVEPKPSDRGSKTGEALPGRSADKCGKIASHVLPHARPRSRSKPDHRTNSEDFNFRAISDASVYYEQMIKPVAEDLVYRNKSVDTLNVETSNDVRDTRGPGYVKANKSVDTLNIESSNNVQDKRGYGYVKANKSVDTLNAESSSYVHGKGAPTNQPGFIKANKSVDSIDVEVSGTAGTGPQQHSSQHSSFYNNHAFDKTNQLVFVKANKSTDAIDLENSAGTSLQQHSSQHNSFYNNHTVERTKRTKKYGSNGAIRDEGQQRSGNSNYHDEMEREFSKTLPSPTKSKSTGRYGQWSRRNQDAQKDQHVDMNDVLFKNLHTRY